MKHWGDTEILAEARKWSWHPEGSREVRHENFLIVDLPDGWDASVVEELYSFPSSSVLAESCDAARDAGSTRISWWLRGEDLDRRTEEQFVRAGFELEEEVEVLSFSLFDGSPPGTRTDDAFAVEAVEDERTLRECVALDADIFGFPSPSEEDISSQAAAMKDDDVHFRFLARIDGEAVSSAGFTLVDEVARLWGAGTLPGYRGRGAYTSLVEERCKVARSLGAGLALVKARTGTSGPILRRIGFRASGRERRYGRSIA